MIIMDTVNCRYGRWMDVPSIIIINTADCRYARYDDYGHC